MSTSTAVINGSLIYILVFIILLFILILFFMIYFLVRYRKTRNPVPEELPESRLIETAWVIVPTLLVMTFFIYGLTGFKFLRNVPPDSYKIKVLSRQWSWLFEYPNGKKSPDLVVPMGKDIVCDLYTADVIHGFYIPAYRIQQDIVPGLPARVWFKATGLENADILCSQYCGNKHSAMLAKVIVIPPGQFEDWLEGKPVQLSGAASYSNMAPGMRLIYERGCISCHSLEGANMAGPTFKGLFGSKVEVVSSGVTRVITADTKYIRNSIINPDDDVVAGFPNIMPSGKDVLSKEELDEVVETIEKQK